MQEHFYMYITLFSIAHTIAQTAIVLYREQSFLCPIFRKYQNASFFFTSEFIFLIMQFSLPHHSLPHQ